MMHRRLARDYETRPGHSESMIPDVRRPAVNAGTGSGSTSVMSLPSHERGKSRVGVAGQVVLGSSGGPGRDSVAHPPWHYVEVKVRHRLFRSRAAGAQDVDSGGVQGAPHGRGHALDQCHRRSEDVVRGVEDVRVVLCGDDESVPRRQWIQRGEGAGPVFTSHPVRRVVTYESTECAVHGLTLPQAPGSSPGDQPLPARRS